MPLLPFNEFELLEELFELRVFLATFNMVGQRKGVPGVFFHELVVLSHVPEEGLLVGEMIVGINAVVDLDDGTLIDLGVLGHLVELYWRQVSKQVRLAPLRPNEGSCLEIVLGLGKHRPPPALLEDRADQGAVVASSNEELLLDLLLSIDH